MTEEPRHEEQVSIDFLSSMAPTKRRNRRENEHRYCSNCGTSSTSTWGRLIQSLFVMLANAFFVNTGTPDLLRCARTLCRQETGPSLGMYFLMNPYLLSHQISRKTITKNGKQPGPFAICCKHILSSNAINGTKFDMLRK
jgi:hypothetical protein